MHKLTGRLGYLLAEIPDGAETLADIGADHGKLIVSAVLYGKSNHGIAIDISSDSLKKAQELAEKHNLCERIDFYVGNGFLPLKNKVDVAVIAGMGGNETVSILKQGDYAKKYILSPHQDAHILREYLKNNNFAVTKDFVIFDKKYYCIIVAEKGENDYDENEIYLGKNLPETSEFSERNIKRFTYLKNLIELSKNSIVKKPFSDEIVKEYEVLQKWYESRK